MATAFAGAPPGAPAKLPFAGLRVAILIGDGSHEGTIAVMQKVLRAGLTPAEEHAIFRGNIERLLGYAS